MNPTWWWRAALTGTIAVAPVLAGAQTPLTLREALQRARRVSPVVTMADARVRSAIGRGREQLAIANPFLEYRRENVGADVLPDIFATATWTLPLAPRRLALRAATSAATDRARADSSGLLLDLDASVATAFVAAARDARLVDIARADAAALDGIAIYDSTRASQGAAAEVLAIRARVAADRAALAVSSAQANAARSRAVLAQLLALATDSVAVDTAVLSHIPTPALLTTLPGDARLAPAVRAALAAEREAGRRSTAERLAIVPDVVVAGGTKQSGGIDSYVASVGMALPLFNFNRGARERSRAEAAMATAERAITEQRLRAQVAGATAALRALIAAPPMAGIRLRARDAAQIMQAAYTEGGVTLLELLEARRAHAEAESATAHWQAEVLHAWIEWRRLTGLPQDEITP